MPSFQTDDFLVGRAVELDELHAALARSKAIAGPAIVRIVGGSGLGKTTLLRTTLDRAKRSGWLDGAVTCYPVHRQHPLAVLSGVVRSLLRSLGPNAPQYVSGLEAALAPMAPALAPALDRRESAPALSPAQAEAAFLRLLQGILNDLPVVVGIDDASYADFESVRILDYVFDQVASYPFVVIATGRVDGDVPFAAPVPAKTVVLRPLSDAQAEEIVGVTFPGAAIDVARAIVGYAAGVPLDVVTLAAHAASENVQTADDVLGGLRAVISSELGKTAPNVRGLLQLCSVIPAPVPVRLLVEASGLPEGDVLEMLTRDVERYLVRNGAFLRFRHQLIADAVRSTLVNDLGLQRRVLDALLHLDASAIDDLERIVELAGACGDRELQRDYLMRMADEAYRALRFESAVEYYRRARDLRSPGPDEYVGFFIKFATSLRANDYDAEAARVLTDALRDAEERGVKDGLGVLAAALILTLCTLDELDRAQRLYEYYFERLQSPGDRSEVLSSAACMFADTMQFLELESALRLAARLPLMTNYANAKLALAQATAESRLGDHEAASRALKSAAFYADLDHSLLSYNIRFDQLFVDFRHYGNVALKERLPEIAREVSAETGTHAFATYLAAFSDFLDGAWERALARLAEINRGRYTPAVRARLMSVPAAIQAFSLQPSPYAEEVRADVDTLIRGLHDRSAVQLGTWWLAYAATTDRAAAEQAAPTLQRWSLKAPTFSSLSFMPVSMALFAVRTADREMLRGVADGVNVRDKSPWMEANVLLAQGVAMRALDDQAGAPVLRDSAQRFKRLGSPFLAAYAAAAAGDAGQADSSLLRGLNVATGGGVAGTLRSARRGSGPTVRELEIARLVASGYTNRQIAQELVLSERTIEVHIANLFAKLSLTSRTHLTRWVYEHGEAQA